MERVITAPGGDRFVVEAWRPFDGLLVPPIGPLFLLLGPGWRIRVRRYPVTFLKPVIYRERARSAAQAERRLAEIADALEAGTALPRRR